jgi:hypothetical protein
MTIAHSCQIRLGISAGVNSLPSSATMDLYAQNKDHFESKQMTIGSIEMVNSADKAHFIGTNTLNSTSATFLSLDFSQTFD